MNVLFPAIALFAATLAWVLRSRRYRAWFRRPVNRSDRFICRGAHHEILVHVGEHGLCLPQDIGLLGRTVLLRLTIKPRWLGRFREPCISLVSEGLSHRQYFERSAAGARYLNLSPLLQRAGTMQPTHIGLKGVGVTWASEASLFVYDAPVLGDGSLLVLAPHPDDAEIAAFGLYAGRASWVATITAGERATSYLPADLALDSRFRWAALLRVADSLSVPQLGQVPPERCVNLSYPDGALESMYRDPERPFMLACERTLPRSRLRSGNLIAQFRDGEPGCTWTGLVAELRLLIETTKPSVIVCPHPLVDSHPDHVHTTKALAQALGDLPDRRPLILLYAVHCRGAPTHPFGPAESIVSLPPGSYDEWVADSLYSHPLGPELRQAKYFAVDAMHAVRRGVQASGRSNLAKLKSACRNVADYVSGIGPDPTSFLRRAPRPNEIYFAVSYSALADLMRRSNEGPGVENA